MNPSRKKELLSEYKQKEKNGGIYAIRCSANDKRWIDCTQDLPGMKNRFDFCVLTNTALHHALQKDWKTYGAGAFTFDTLETVPPKEGELEADYKHGLELLRDCLRDECPPELRYW